MGGIDFIRVFGEIIRKYVFMIRPRFETDK